MAAFEYKALGADGKKTSGIINADNKKQARSQLKEKGALSNRSQRATVRKKRHKGRPQY